MADLPGFPRDLGPPPLKEGEGRDLLAQRSPIVSVALDAGAFRAVWELVEAAAVKHWPQRDIYVYSGALVRALSAFREANNGPPPEKKTVIIKRRKGKK